MTCSKLKSLFKVFSCKSQSKCESTCFTCNTTYGDNKIETSVNGVSIIDVDLNDESVKTDSK